MFAPAVLAVGLWAVCAAEVKQTSPIDYPAQPAAGTSLIGTNLKGITSVTEIPPEASAGVSLVTSGGQSVLANFKGITDPFAELSDEFAESMLAADEGPMASAGKPTEGPSFSLDEEAPVATKDDPATEPKAAPAAPPPSDTLYYLLLSVLVGTFGLVTGGLQRFWPGAPTTSKAKALEEDEKDSSAKADPKEPPTLRPGTTACDKEEEDEYGCTALHAAADRGDAREVGALLERGADVNKREAWDETPLHFAARAGSVEACKLLLEHGAEVNPANESGCTPLLVAAQAGHEKVCELLLERGAHIAGVPDTELPPLLSALLVQRVFAEATPVEEVANTDSEHEQASTGEAEAGGESE